MRKILLATVTLDDPKYLVRRRIDLVRKLTEIQVLFNGKDDSIMVGENSWDHPARDYQALRFYLLLTCFDILGQPANWMPYSSWLEKKRNPERDDVIDNEAESLPLEISKKLNNKYTEIYGVKNSFYRFINEVITAERRTELLHSIRISKAGATIAATDNDKLKFLFKMRNAHTHSGSALASAGGMITGVDALPVEIDGKIMYGYSNVFSEKGLDYGVRRWPSLLFEILEDCLKNDQFYWIPPEHREP